MGSGQSTQSEHHVKPTEKPMPALDELDRMFSKTLDELNMPRSERDKMKDLPPDKKWQIVQESGKSHSKHPPSYYIDTLKQHIDPKIVKKRKDRKRLPKELIPSDALLTELEISLRTNPLTWVKEFVDDPNRGYFVIVEFLKVLQAMHPLHHTILALPQKEQQQYKTPEAQAATQAVEKDIHLCILCLKALMNNTYGFQHVMSHEGCIDVITECMHVPHQKTIITALELLAAVCLLGGKEGHKRTLTSMDRFQVINKEAHRFETLVQRFSDTEMSIDLRASILSFINVLVHSVNEMNFRVYLQYEFTLLGLEEAMRKAAQEDIDKINIQLDGYQNNFINVDLLALGMESAHASLFRSDSKLTTFSNAVELGDDSRLQASLARVVELEKELAMLKDEHKENMAEVQKNAKAIDPALVEQYVKQIEANQQEIEDLKKELTSVKQAAKAAEATGPPAPPAHSTGTLTSAKVVGSPPPEMGGPPPPPPVPEMGGPPPPPPPAPPAAPPAPEMGGPPPPPPPPPPAPGMGGPPPPPPPPGMGGPLPPPGMGAPLVPLKRKIQPNVPLPVFNWVPIQKVDATIFKEIDDENFHKGFDYKDFEERFKRENKEVQTKELPGQDDSLRKKKEDVQVIESNRSRNVVFAKRKVNLKPEKLVEVINKTDGSQLSTETIEILLHCIPNPEEAEALKHHADDIQKLAEGDQFMYILGEVERCEIKLKSMLFVQTLDETLMAVKPQIDAIYAASNTLISSKRLKKIFEIILAFGNYMNSAKRGGAFGFKISALDRLRDTKGNDRHLTLLNYIVMVCSDKYPDLNKIIQDLEVVKLVVNISMQGLTSDVNELKTGTSIIASEAQKQPNNQILQKTADKAKDKVGEVEKSFQKMQEKYNEAVKYFGEDPARTEPSEFFSVFAKFNDEYLKAIKENEAYMQKAQKAHAEAKGLPPPPKEQVKDGAIDLVISEIRQRGFRREETLHRKRN